MAELNKSALRTYDKKKSRLKRQMYLIMRKYSVNADFIVLCRYFKKLLERKKEIIRSLKGQLRVAEELKKSQTKPNENKVKEVISDEIAGDTGWLVHDGANDERNEGADEESQGKGISLADQVKEAAEAAMQQTGMVFDENTGMYYDYKTGYYYNPELGLYFHSSTNCYYYYSEDQSQFVYHSQADMSQYNFNAESTNRPQRKKHATKHKQSKSEDRDTSDSEDKGTEKKKKRTGKTDYEAPPCLGNKESSFKKERAGKRVARSESNQTGGKSKRLELEDGECTSSDDEPSLDRKIVKAEDSDSGPSQSDESVAKHYPPSMRIIVQETMVGSLKKGTLFLLTKDGGTLGREGKDHTVLIPDENVSRHHLSFIYDSDKSVYQVVDLGSRNGTFLDGKRLSVAKQESDKFEVAHGNTLELGSTKLLCHIHQGNDTCNECEPGLLIAGDKAEPTRRISRNVNLKKMHKEELQRLKTKYAAKPKDQTKTDEIATNYKDRADSRRKTVGSSHDSEKTEQSSLESSIAPTNKGFKLLSKMGWSAGEGLGKNAQGGVQPVALVSNTGAMGLGSGGVMAPRGDAPTAAAAAAVRRSTVWLKTQKRFDAVSKAKIFKDADSEEDE